MNSPAVDIANILASSAFSYGVVGTDLFVSREPLEPVNCTTIYDTGGYEPESADVVYDRPTIMARVRNSSYASGYAKAQAIKTALHKANQITEGGTRYIALWAQSDILFIGYDDSNRALFTINFRIHRTNT